MSQILIGVGGGIAAYKVCEVVSSLAKAGHQVRVVLTDAAQQFVSPLTFATLARYPAYCDRDFWQPTHVRPLHIELAEWADLCVLAPLTANTLAKLANGLADNLLTNIVLASTCPILLVPAMNTDMWQQQSVQRNWQMVQQDARYHSMEPGAGLLACDRIGKGRMAEPPEILAHLESLLHTQGQRDLSGKHLLISAASTREYLDPVRFIGNPSTGKMGIALAQAAQHRGASVTLVHGPMESHLLDLVPTVQKISVTSAHEMHQSLRSVLPQADWIIMAAAVADVRPISTAAAKLPKSELPGALPLEFVPDIAADLGQQKQPHQILIGFAAQTGDIVTPALRKLKEKGLDAIAANPIDQINSGFGTDSNQATFISATGRQLQIAPCSKLKMAHQLYDFVQQQL